MGVIVLKAYITGIDDQIYFARSDKNDAKIIKKYNNHLRLLQIHVKTYYNGKNYHNFIILYKNMIFLHIANICIHP